MGPINIRYHVISLAAVFLALGVGIIVGSNTNFFGISSLIEKQNTVISKLEENHKRKEREAREATEEANKRGEYIQVLEEDVVMRLLAGKLDGLRLGIVIVGDFQDETVNAEQLEARLKAAGSTIGWNMSISLARMEELMNADSANFTRQLAGELLLGSPFGTQYTDVFMNERLVATGGFEESVGGVVFVLGDELDIRLMRRILLSLETEITDGKGLVINVTPGENKTYRGIFRAQRYQYFQNTAELPGQAEAISSLSEMYIQQKELKRDGD